MNKLDILARDKFAGDIDKTIEYVFSSLSPEEREGLTKDLTGVQVSAFSRYVSKKAKEKGIDIQKIADEEFSLASMQLSKEDVMDMEVNPFKAKIGKDILKFIFLNAGLVSLYLITSSIDKGMADSLMIPAGTVASLINTYFSFGTVKDMLDYFKFNKLKKRYENEKYDSQTLDGYERSK